VNSPENAFSDKLPTHHQLIWKEVNSVNSKNIVTSKTFWFNLLAGLVAIAGQFDFGSFDPDTGVITVALGIVALVNLILRYLTDQGVHILPA